MEFEDLKQHHLKNGWKIKMQRGEKNFDLLSGDGHYIRNIREENRHKGGLLISLIKAYGLKSGAEIGTSPGGTAQELLAKASLRPFIMVERYPVKKLWGLLLMHDFPLTKEGDTQKPWVLMRMNTEEAHKFIADHSLGFVYIDCQHRYENVRDDIRNWMPKVQKGGVLAGHDYNPWGDPTRGGVAKAVDERFPSVNLEIDSDSKNCSWWVQV